MPIQEADTIWVNGDMVPWHKATTHVLTHALLYGTSAFEGMRAYDTAHMGPCIFRNKAHMERLMFSARVYRIDVPYSVEELESACLRTVRENNLPSAYIRVDARLGYGEMGPSSRACTTDVAIAAFPWGQYLGADGVKNGIDVCVSSWRRSAPGTIPAGVKAAGNYLSSRLITMEAADRGCVEGIGLAHDGTVSEGGGENLFLVLKDKIYTPPMASSILGGITRDSVMTLAAGRGYEVIEQAIPREMLYAADELFFTGTAAEVTPIKSLDGILVGRGEKLVTKSLQDDFFGLFSGKIEDQWGWLTPVG